MTVAVFASPCPRGRGAPRLALSARGNCSEPASAECPHPRRNGVLSGGAGAPLELRRRASQAATTRPAQAQGLAIRRETRARAVLAVLNEVLALCKHFDRITQCPLGKRPPMQSSTVGRPTNGPAGLPRVVLIVSAAGGSRAAGRARRSIVAASAGEASATPPRPRRQVRAEEADPEQPSGSGRL